MAEYINKFVEWCNTPEISTAINLFSILTNIVLIILFLLVLFLEWRND